MSEICPKCNRHAIRLTVVVGKKTYCTCNACDYTKTRPSASTFKETRLLFLV